MVGIDDRYGDPTPSLKTKYNHLSRRRPYGDDDDDDDEDDGDGDGDGVVV